MPWDTAVWMGIAAVAVALFSHFGRGPRMLVVTATEASLVLMLYALWQYVRRMAITRVAGAHENALALWRFEQRLHIGSELMIQQALLDRRLTMQFLNVYYAGLHVPAMGVALIWMFVRHRQHYAHVRNSLAMLIAACITTQALVPMAPPRFLTSEGFVDAALKYGQSVYGVGGSGVSNELAALPSLHAGWSILVAHVAIVYGSGRWRWLAVLHPLLTMLSIVATANHWWLDAVLAGIYLVFALWLDTALRAAMQRAVVPTLVGLAEPAQ